MISNVVNLSFEVFDEYFLTWLCTDHFQRPVFSEKSVDRYFCEFKRFTNEHFIEVCNEAFTQKFLPDVQWFLEQRQLILDREYRESTVYSPVPPISEEQRLINVARMAEMFARFKQSSSF